MISLFFGAQNDAIATKANASDVYTLNVTPKTDIAENTNLGSLLTPGKYVCNSSAIAATLLNAPYNTNKVTYAFYMVVEKGTSESYTVQTLYGIGYATCPTFRRFYNSSSGVWSLWKYIDSVAATIPTNTNLNSYIVPGRWICPTAAIAESLSGCPVTQGFILDIDNGTNVNYIAQTLKVTTQATVPEYRRLYTVDTWGAWKQIV